MSKKLFLYFLIFSSATQFFTKSFAEEGSAKSSGTSGSWTGNVNLAIASKMLDEDQWSPYHEHASFSYSIDFTRRSSGWGIVLGGVASSHNDDENDAESSSNNEEVTTEEARLGLIKTWFLTEKFRVYGSGGAALIKGTISTNSTKIEDEESGTYFEVGFYWTLINAINLGFVFDTSTADIILNNTTYNAGGSRAGLIIGYHW